MNPLAFLQKNRHRIHSVGSPHGMLTLAPKNEPVRRVVANRKNRRYAAKIKRELATERRIAERRKGKTDADSKSQKD